MCAVREELAAWCSGCSAAGHGRGDASPGHYRTKLPGVRDSDDRILLPSCRDSRHHLCGTGEWQTADRRPCRGESCLEQRQNVVLGVVRSRTRSQSVLAVDLRSRTDQADRSPLDMWVNSKVRAFVGLFVAALGIISLRIFDPATSGLFPPCPLHYLTGWYCPGCGSLRAMHALLHGNLQQAWAMNPLTIVLLPFVAYGLASELIAALRGRGLPQPVLPASYPHRVRRNRRIRNCQEYSHAPVQFVGAGSDAATVNCLNFKVRGWFRFFCGTPRKFHKSGRCDGW